MSYEAHQVRCRVAKASDTPDCLKSLTQEEYDALPELTEDEIKAALDKGAADMKKIAAARRKPRGRY